ncbi:MAG: DUF2933 domain-containing protein [Desulforhopalus sp.]
MTEIQKTIDKLSRLKWSHIVFVGVAFGGAFLVWDQFSSQIGSYLPYLILLLCPLMHVFLHRGHGHGGHGDHQNHKNETDSQRQ